MVKHMKFGIKLVVFTLILSFLIFLINYILTPKKYFDNEWPTTTCYKGFYQMQENSIDVLFLGSSHAAAAYSPQVAYNNYGTRSYNLGCEQQNILVSYYWLKEALHYQTPKVVVLDTLMLFEYNPADPLNTSESHTRMAMDAMKWSKVKMDAVQSISAHDNKQTFSSYLFKNIRFHTRWTSLSEQDFTFRNIERHYELKGYTPLNDRGVNVHVDYQPFSDCDTERKIEMVPLMEEYLNNIVSLCSDNGIQLLLIKTPTTDWNVAEHNTVQAYADENGIRFIDFNMQNIYDECGFVYSADMNEDSHCNIWGSEKISLYLAGVFYNSYGICGGDYYEQWSETADYYAHVLEDCNLKHITGLDEYIDAINRDRYTILMAVQHDMSSFASDEVKEAFLKLGFDLSSERYDSFYGVKSDSLTTQAVGPETLRYAGNTRNNMLDFVITSSGYNAGNTCSIIIDNIEYAKKRDGLNIIVYSNETRKIVDTATFDGSLYR